MTSKPTNERPEQDDAQAAFMRLQKLTKALLGVDKTEYEQKRAEYEQGKDRRSVEESNDRVH